MSVARGVLFAFVVSAVQLAAADIVGGEVAHALEDKEALQSPSAESLYGNNYQTSGRRYTEHTGVGHEISNAFQNSVIGFVLFLLGFPVLFFNEWRQAKMWELFGRAAKITRANVSPDKILEDNDRGLVHVSGTTTNADKITDPLFNFSVNNCAKLERSVEMYLWTEEKHEISKQDTNTGGTTTEYEYRYKQEWCSHHVDSSSFREPGHENPPKMEISSDSFVGVKVMLGAFTLPAALKNRLCNSVNCTSDANVNGSKGQKMLQMNFKNVGGWLSTEQGSPNIGDYRVSFSKVPCGPTTVLAVQVKDTFCEMAYTAKVENYKVDVGSLSQPLLEEGAPPQQQIGIQMSASQGSSNPCSCCPCCACCSCVGSMIESGESVYEIEERNCSAEDMLNDAGSTQNCIHKALMIVGWLLMVIGINMFLSVVPALFRIIPFIGTYVQAFGNFVVSIVAFVFGSFFALITIAFGWLTIRPFKAMALITLALVIFFLPTIIDAAGVRESCDGSGPCSWVN